MDTPIINKTGRAVVSLAIMVFSIGTIVWLILHGVDKNSLHGSALSWSYTLLCIAMFALGLDAAVTKILPILTTPAQPPKAP